MMTSDIIPDLPEFRAIPPQIVCYNLPRWQTRRDEPESYSQSVPVAVDT
jgi:hypothetical protein